LYHLAILVAIIAVKLAVILKTQTDSDFIRASGGYQFFWLY
jgi:hypothetical protein